MKRLIFATLLAMTAPLAHGSTLVRVDDADNFCARIVDGLCHEWALEADSRLRVVFHGFEDGSSYSLYRRGGFGYYRHLFDFAPVLQVGDDEQQAIEYPGDITQFEIATATGRNVRVLASFELTWEHQRAVSDTHPLPHWQARMPALLFTRASPLHGSPVPQQTFTPVTPERLRKYARQQRPGCKPHADWELLRKCP